jgi:predicted glycoside hydrolase/deacetylase ChbG (UPF0249 family)
MNPFLKELGYGANDRVLMVHADDIGMCQASTSVLGELFEAGIVKSAATMVPCPWFLEAAELCRQNPQFDMGVHLTLNAEWSHYRWSALSTRDQASGLLDAQGFLHSSTAATHDHADPHAVALEIQAQFEAAVRAGIEPTHIDSHMGTLYDARFLDSYVDLAKRNNLPLMFFTEPASLRLREQGVGQFLDSDFLRPYWQDLTASHMPMFDSMLMLPLDNPHDQVGLCKQIVDSLEPGLTILIVHPAHDTPELRALTSSWPSRVANYQACVSSELRSYIDQASVQLIGYRPLRDLMRQKAATK